VTEGRGEGGRQCSSFPRFPLSQPLGPGQPVTTVVADVKRRRVEAPASGMNLAVKLAQTGQFSKLETFLNENSYLEKLIAVSLEAGQFTCGARLFLLQRSRAQTLPLYLLHPLLRGLVLQGGAEADDLCTRLLTCQVDLGSVLNHREEGDGRTLLHLLVSRGRCDKLLKMMLDRGGSDRIADAKGVTVQSLLT
jgi:hypothetical protein